MCLWIATLRIWQLGVAFGSPLKLNNIVQSIIPGTRHICTILLLTIYHAVDTYQVLLYGHAASIATKIFAFVQSSCCSQCSIGTINTITGGHSKYDLRLTQKPLYFAIFTNNIWSYLLCPPVIPICVVTYLVRISSVFESGLNVGGEMLRWHTFFVRMPPTAQSDMCGSGSAYVRFGAPHLFSPWATNRCAIFLGGVVFATGALFFWGLSTTVVTFSTIDSKFLRDVPFLGN